MFHEAQAVMQNWVQRLPSLASSISTWNARNRLKSRNTISAPDLDKLRAALDGITGILINDDSQVVDLRATKNYAGEDEGRPGAWITIETL